MHISTLNIIYLIYKQWHWACVNSYYYSFIASYSPMNWHLSLRDKLILPETLSLKTLEFRVSKSYIIIYTPREIGLQSRIVFLLRARRVLALFVVQLLHKQQGVCCRPVSSPYCCISFYRSHGCHLSSVSMALSMLHNIHVQFVFVQ